MPHSPYETTVHPAVEDLNDYQENYEDHRSRWRNHESDDNREHDLLHMTGKLLRQCVFLEGKLDIKKREHSKLAKHFDELKKEHSKLAKHSDELKKVVEPLKYYIQTQKTEITALKSELEKAEVVTGTDEQLGSDSDDIGVESDSRDVSGGKPEEGDGSVNPRKRDAEVDNTIDGRTMKKGRVANVRDNSMVSEGAADNSLVSGK